MKWYEEFYTNDYINMVGFAPDGQTHVEGDFILSALTPAPGAQILDLCCGYGRHANLLARSGDYEVTGMDLSGDYLEIARKNVSSSNITFIKGDMRDIPFTGYFDAVYNMFTSFGFFESDGENESVLKQVNKCLKPQGLFLLDYENKFYFVANDVYKKEKYWEKTGDESCILHENWYDVMTEREIFRVSFMEKGVIKMSSGYDIRLYSFPEISAMLKRCGFEVLNVWGDYTGAEYSVKSKRLIVLSRKTGQHS